jgi:hypothetical protein
MLAVAAGRGWDRGNNDEGRLMTGFIAALASGHDAITRDRAEGLEIE